MTKEIWKAVHALPYEVSSLGRVRRLETKRVLKPDVVRGGYEQVSLFLNGFAYRKKVHAIVALAFIGPRPHRAQINHLDCAKRNNRPENLEYTTRKENAHHAVKNGRYRRGSIFYKSHITEAQVIELRRRYTPGNGAELGRELGIARQTVFHIIHRNTWTHI